MLVRIVFYYFEQPSMFIVVIVSAEMFTAVFFLQ
jgi:hypothetical protein